ncbi:vacuolar protein sorting-associated protein 55 homolog isoform X4 [Coffea arabica]|uniref:Vacuolar protein sorting-associated protein 55 homolog isoform X4 n=1 Tax=Coffea arabica TaxID=13443 RepID=A0ABM4UMF5_COFAR
MVLAHRMQWLAFMFSASILLQILACAIYSNWWPLLSALMYVLVPMPCMFFGGGTTQFLTSRDGGGWIDAAKFLTGASAVGSLAIPIILRCSNRQMKNNIRNEVENVFPCI